MASVCISTEREPNVGIDRSRNADNDKRDQVSGYPLKRQSVPIRSDRKCTKGTQGIVSVVWIHESETRHHDWSNDGHGEYAATIRPEPVCRRWWAGIEHLHGTVYCHDKDSVVWEQVRVVRTPISM